MMLRWVNCSALKTSLIKLSFILKRENCFGLAFLLPITYLAGNCKRIL